jgi:GAF domain-containing protein
VEPVPETEKVLVSLGAWFGDHELAADLRRKADQAAVVAPGLLGLSLGVVRHGLTLTYLATDQDIARLDGLQYLDGGPCVHAADTGEIQHVDIHDAVDEGRWLMFAQASAATGVSSTLSLPVLEGDRVTVGINLYGRTPDTFVGREHQLAQIFGAWAPGAVANADLSFTTRWQAALAPLRLEEMNTFDRATGIVAEQQHISVDAAKARLEEAATRAGVAVPVLAQLIVDTAPLDQ